MSEALKRVRNAIKARREELAAYEVEERLHQSELTSLEAEGTPADWPDNLKAFKGVPRDQLVSQVPSDQLELAMDLSAQDQVRHNLLTVQMELRTSRRRLAAIMAELPDNEPEETPDALDAGLSLLESMVADPSSPVEGFSVDASSLRELTDGTGVGKVTLKLSGGQQQKKVIVVRPSGELKTVDGE